MVNIFNPLSYSTNLLHIMIVINTIKSNSCPIKSVLHIILTYNFPNHIEVFIRDIMHAYCVINGPNIFFIIKILKNKL